MLDPALPPEDPERTRLAKEIELQVYHGSSNTRKTVYHGSFYVKISTPPTRAKMIVEVALSAIFYFWD